MMAFLHFVSVPLCFAYSSEGWKEALPPFESALATVGRMVFLTFDVCTLEERAEFRLVCLFLWISSSHIRSSTGEVSLLVRSQAACVLNHRTTKPNHPATQPPNHNPPLHLLHPPPSSPLLSSLLLSPSGPPSNPPIQLHPPTQPHHLHSHSHTWWVSMGHGYRSKKENMQLLVARHAASSTTGRTRGDGASGSFLPGTQNTVNEVNPATLSSPNTHPSFLDTKSPLTSGSFMPPARPPNLQGKERSLHLTNSAQRLQE